MTNLFITVGLLIGMLYRANKEFGKISNKKIYYSHIALMMLTAIITSFSLNVFLQIIFNFESVMQTMHVKNSLLNPTINNMFLILVTVLSVFVLFTIFNVAMRSNKARKLLVNTIPILLILTIIRTINEVFIRSTEETPLGFIISFSIIFIIIIYVPTFLFYKNKNVINTIFETRDTNSKVTKNTEE